MNVLIATFLVPTSPSGVVTYCRTLAKDLTREGVQVTQVDASHTPTVWKKVLGVLKRIMRPLGGASWVVYDEFAYFTGLYLATRKHRNAGIDLIHAQDVRSGVAAYLALGRRTPIVLTCHFNDDPVKELVLAYALKPSFTRQLTAWYQYLFSYVKNYVFVSNYAYTQSRHLLPEDITKRVLPNTVQLEGVSVSRTPSPTLTITNVGHIDERKNQKLLIEIGHELRSRNLSNFNIWLIGDGPKRQEYEQLAETLGLKEQVKFYGRHTAPWQLVAQSDLYIHTALNDNCPYSIIEAFAVQTPVLALPVGGIPEMLPESNGPLRGTDARSLASEIAPYFEADRRASLTEAQAIHADYKFNHRKSVNELITFYRQTAQEPLLVTAQAIPV